MNCISPILKAINVELTQIIEGCKRGDRRAQNCLYELMYEKMKVVCLSFTHNLYDAEDLLQEGFLKVFLKIRDFRDEGSFEGWVRKIFIRLSLDWVDKWRPNLLFIDEEVFDRLPGGYQDGESRMSEKEILTLVQLLPPSQRAAFQLMVVEGLSHRQVSGVLGIGEGTSKSNLAHAKAHLRYLIQKINK
jgi:RNA polymerase sigma factor (sigma-70 family)